MRSLDSFRPLLLIFLIALSACQRAKPEGPIPPSWIVRSELDAETDAGADALVSLPLDTQTLLEDLVAAPEKALEEIPSAAPPPRVEPAPWRMHAFVTDLAVSLNGWIGALVTKGTPSVTLHWRRKRSAPRAAEVALPTAFEAEPDLRVSQDTSSEALRSQLEPAVVAAVGSGRVRDESALRRNLHEAAIEFQKLGTALEHSRHGPWWVSRLRMDLVSDFSGKITPAVEAGGDLRFRFEWFRLKGASVIAESRATAKPLSRMAASLKNLADTLGQDLIALSEDPDPSGPKGFQAHTFRIGFGITHQAEIGIATAKNSIYGHLFFSRDVPKPSMKEPPAPPSEGNVLLISESKTSRIERKRFRKGLRKALKISRFFTRAASRTGKGRWRIHELKTGLDLNLAGKTGLAPVTGVATSEIFFYNENF